MGSTHTHEETGACVTARDDIKPSESGTWAQVKNSTKSVTDYDAHAAQSADAVLAPLGTPSNPSSEIFTLANFITLCRFLLTIAFLVLFVNHANRYLALTLYAVAALTDFLDGWVARSTQTVSWLGKIMDPIMDRVLLFTGVLGLMARGELPVWVAAFVILRDVYLACGSLRLQKYRRRPVDVAFIGKVTTALLMVGFCDLLLDLPVVPGLDLVNVPWLPGLNGQPVVLGMYFVYLGLVCSFLTAVLYTMEGYRIKKEVLAEAGNETHA